ncbi:hypothetical protein [Lysinibacillus xylanilyticus]
MFSARKRSGSGNYAKAELILNWRFFHEKNTIYWCRLYGGGIDSGLD